MYRITVVTDNVVVQEIPTTSLLNALSTLQRLTLACLKQRMLMYNRFEYKHSKLNLYKKNSLIGTVSVLGREGLVDPDCLID
jgi:hypothetical protein